MRESERECEERRRTLTAESSRVASRKGSLSVAVVREWHMKLPQAALGHSVPPRGLQSLLTLLTANLRTVLRLWISEGLTQAKS